MTDISGFIIVRDEEELIQYCLESFCSLGDQLDVLSIVDNGSTDATLAIIDSFKNRLPVVLKHEQGHSHHGNLRNLAMAECHAPWIIYLDSDESWSSDMSDWLRSGVMEQGDAWDFYKWSTILDRYHYVEGGNGPSYRLFRNKPGVTFSQSIHTEAWYPGMGPVRNASGPQLFDHTATKSWESLWAKGTRYAWAHRENVPAVGPIHEYFGRVTDALDNHPERNKEFPDDIKARIFCGPDAVPGHPGIPWNRLVGD